MSERANVFFLVSLLIGISLIFTSCNLSNKNHLDENAGIAAYRSLYQKARLALSANSDSCLIYADSSLKIANTFDFGDSSLISYYRLRAGFFTVQNQMDSAGSNWNRAIAFGEKSNDSLLLAESCLKLGEVYLLKENLELAEKHLSRALTIFRFLGKAYGIAITNVRLGRIFTNKGDIERSQRITMEACRILDSLNLPQLASEAYLVIGNNFAAIGSQNDAIFYSLKAYESAISAKHWEGAVNALTNIGVSYRNVNVDSSIFYYQKALQTAKETGFHGADMIIRYNLATAYMEKNDMYDNYKVTNDLYNPMPLYDSILMESQAQNFPDGMIRAYSGKAVVSELSGNIRLAKNYLRKAIFIADSIDDKTIKLSLMRELARIHREKGDLAAYDTLSAQIILLNDSILNAEKQIAIHDLEQKYQRKKIELEKINLENKLDHEKESARYRLVVIMIMIIFLAGVSLVTVLIYRLLRQKNKAYDALIEKHEEAKLKPLFVSAGPEIMTVPEINTDSSTVNYKTVVQQLQLFFEKEKPFLNPAVKAEDVAERINIPAKSINIALKISGGHNFKTFINKHRVDEMIRVFDDPEYSQIKTEIIAEKAGFGSRQSFYTAFEEVTGVKPGYYRRYLKERNDKVAQD